MFNQFKRTMSMSQSQDPALAALQYQIKNQQVSDLHIATKIVTGAIVECI